MKRLHVAALLCAVIALAAGCASWAEAKPVVRTVNDFAQDFCEATMVGEAERQGISVRDLCLIPFILEPFLQAPAQATAAAHQGMRP